MEKRNMDHWFNELTGSRSRRALPVLTFPGLGLTGRRVIDVVTDGTSQFECIEALAKKYSSAAAVTAMDLSAEAEAFGSKVKFNDNEIPTVTGGIVSDQESLQSLIVPEVGAGRTGIYLKAAELAAKNIGDRPVFGGIIGPYSLTGRLMDMTAAMIAIIEEPDLVHQVLEKCTRFLKAYAQAFKANGVNGIIIAEPAAGLLSPAKCDEFSSKYLKELVAEVQDQNFMVILHNCGNTVKLVDSMVSTGAKALHFGNAVDLKEIMPQVPPDRLVFGNIDPVGVFRNGTVVEVRERVLALLREMEPYRNYVLSSGCDIPPGTPISNIDAFFETLLEYNVRYSYN